MTSDYAFEVIEGSPRVLVTQTRGSMDLETAEQNLIDGLMEFGIHGIRHLLVDWSQLSEYKLEARRAIGSFAPAIDGRFEKVAVVASPQLMSVIADFQSYMSAMEIERFDDKGAALAWLRSR